ncbi:MAG TPA: galactarate dehydratase [Rhodopila sp.]|uniref:galactarate dehydratase n=1 Tax=Rhodopila sp. TaxID=2480087 RepID=UPI002B7864F2|nr:galactarate dehydratase [Rhodopila sp.]HVY14171.1 galactarate dehydratase [Rhodopila sp.]
MNADFPGTLPEGTTLQGSGLGAPRTIKLDPRDNVAIVATVGGLGAGTVFPDGLALRERVPQGHKVALEDIPSGQPILRYGTVIGTAIGDIPRGAWVAEAKVQMPDAPDLATLSRARAAVAEQPKLEGHTWEGFRNPDGSVGTRNILAVSTSVQCVAGTLEFALERVRKELLPRYPNVDAVVALTHTYGCGVAINAPDAAVPIRTLHNLARNPNFGGQAMVVGLGCEKLLPERLLPERPLPERPLSERPLSERPLSDDAPANDVMRLQDEAFHGFGPMVEAITGMCRERLEILDRRRRETVPVSDLVVGTQCGGSDAFSGVTANPALGFAADLIVRAGGTVMFSEVTEVRDGIGLLTARAADDKVAEDLIREMAWYDAYLARGGADRSANTTPGNKKGGLVNIVEKAMGSIIKSGTSPIVEVLSPGARPTRKGMIFAATPASDFICGTLQLASGIGLQVFTTGRGTPYGLAAAPVIKVATNSVLARRWHDLIDYDAGGIATGETTIEEAGWALFRLILDTASGRTKPWAERWGIGNALALFNPAPVT